MPCHISPLPLLLIAICGSLCLAQTEPNLPAVPFDYHSYAVTNLPEQYLATPPFGDVEGTINTPPDNPITNPGATLGRVLFYDKRLSLNNSISCASCHTHETGFGDVRQFSVGHSGLLTPRHSMTLVNAVFYESGNFRWDESAATLEEQCLIPIEAADEMGLPLDQLRTRIESTPFYTPLFVDAFGDTTVTNDRIAKAMAQFIRSMVSYNSTYDQAFDVGVDGFPNFELIFNESEQIGQRLFERTSTSISCFQCHDTPAMIGEEPRNIGLDGVIVDAGAGNGRFKTTSLRNVAVRGRFMHDGRFSTLMEVIEFYDHGVQENEFLDDLLRVNEDPNNRPEQFNLTETEKQGLVDFLQTLTDEQFLNDPKFSDPFGPQPLFGDVNLDGIVDLLDVGPFVDRLSDGPYQNEADLNQDGLVTLADVQLFVAALIGR